MKEDVKNEFVDRLINGGFEQIAGSLSVGSNQRCATGILCDIAVEHGILIKEDNVTPDGRAGYKPALSRRRGHHTVGPVCAGNYLSTQAAPEELHDWAGTEHWEIFEMMHLNDNGRTLEQIAESVKNGTIHEEFLNTIRRNGQGI